MIDKQPRKAASIRSKPPPRSRRSTRWLSNNLAGEVLIPGLLKLNIVDRPATRQHEGVNPFTNEPMTYKAKAARQVIKVRPLKALKDAI